MAHSKAERDALLLACFDSLVELSAPEREARLAALRQEAVDFQWSPLQPAADLFASKQVIGYAEEAHKVLGGLTTNDESVMIYGAYSLVLGLSDIIAVQHGLMLESENTAFQQVMELMSMTSKWTICFRAAAGYTLSTARERARASLCLYAETARHLHAIIEPRHADVINAALNLIETDVIRFELTSTN